MRDANLLFQALRDRETPGGTSGCGGLATTAHHHGLQQFPRPALRSTAFTERDQDLDRQGIDPPVQLLPFPPMPGLGIQPARAVCRIDLSTRHPS